MCKFSFDGMRQDPPTSTDPDGAHQHHGTFNRSSRMNSDPDGTKHYYEPATSTKQQQSLSSSSNGAAKQQQKPSILSPSSLSKLLLSKLLAKYRLLTSQKTPTQTTCNKKSIKKFGKTNKKNNNNSSNKLQRKDLLPYLFGISGFVLLGLHIALHRVATNDHDRRNLRATSSNGDAPTNVQLSNLDQSNFVNLESKADNSKALKLKELIEEVNSKVVAPISLEKGIYVQGAKFQPGDNVEIFEGEDTARPGVVSDVNKDGTYNIVQVETGVIWKNLKSPKDFAAYKSYENGVKAVYRQNEQEYVPITIKAFNPFSAKEGWELLGGFYSFTYDRESEPKKTQQGQAVRMHRLIPPKKKAEPAKKPAAEAKPVAEKKPAAKPADEKKPEVKK